jgi:hypothetical protein
VETPPEHEPLGSHEYFSQWATSRAWQGGTVAFGSAVIDDFVTGINEFARIPRKNTDRHWVESAAIGCVPRMNTAREVGALASRQNCCIVIAKTTKDMRAARALQDVGRPIGVQYLPNFDEVGMIGPDGQPPIIGPYGMNREPLEPLGPVRLAGWRGAKNLPLLHAKLLVLGDATGYDNDDDPPWGLIYNFKPTRAWIGSANWTKGSENSLEFGIWVDEPSLVSHVLTFVLDVLRFSEPLDTPHDVPTPQLAEGTWDHEAMMEAMRDMRWSREEDDEDS